MLFEKLVSAIGLSSVNLLPRQEPAVIATSLFLRRAHHSCAQLPGYFGYVTAKKFAAAVVNKWLYIDGGQFSFLNNGTPQYEYGKL